MKKRWRILVIDDEEVMRESLAAWLKEDGYTVETASSGREGIAKTIERGFSIYFIDLKMPGGLDGIETMQEIKKLQPDASVVIITAYATVDTAITAMKRGAQEYLVKPCNLEEISLLVARIVKIQNLQRENALLRKRLAGHYQVEDIVGKSPRMREIFQLIRQVASLRSTVLIEGESGTGKELVARAVHFTGDRADKPFVAISSAALAETLLESELFGHEKGAFTGAAARKKGKFELADGGTLFLDEIGDISPRLQAGLLRVLQERSFYRVGGTEEVKVDVRLITATNRDLGAAVEKGSFREDLYYRLNVISIRIPPLRERPEDIPLLVGHSVERLSEELGREVEGVSEEAMHILISHDWPGNVREVENAVERALVTSRGPLLEARDFAFLSTGLKVDRWTIPSGMTLKELEKEAIAATLDRLSGNIQESARALGIDRSTLYDKIKRYGIERPERG